MLANEVGTWGDPDAEPLGGQPWGPPQQRLRARGSIAVRRGALTPWRRGVARRDRRNRRASVRRRRGCPRGLGAVGLRLPFPGADGGGADEPSAAAGTVPLVARPLVTGACRGTAAHALRARPRRRQQRRLRRAPPRAESPA